MIDCGLTTVCETEKDMHSDGKRHAVDESDSLP